MKVGDVALVCRTKNAGPFRLTADIVFPDEFTFARAKTLLTADVIGRLYGVPPVQVHVTHWATFRVIKATFPRWTGAGGPRDRDVYGCQQHYPIWALEIDEPGPRT